MATRTSNWIHLGDFTDLDTTDDFAYDQTAGDNLVGRTFNYNDMAITSVTYTGEDGTDSYSTNDTWYDTSYGPAASLDYVDPDGLAQSSEIDSHFDLTLSVTLQNGDVVTTNVDMVQATNGDLFISSMGGFASPIVSIKVIAWGGAYTGFAGNRSTQATIVCFTQGTMIDTPSGPTPVERLSPGDPVITLDAGQQPIRWIGSKSLTLRDLTRAPHLRPVRIRRGALGRGRPTQDLVVSPQHRIMVRSKVAARMFGTAEALIAAKHLVGQNGISIASEVEDVRYWHFALDQHQVVMANGAAAETLFTGTEALKAVDPAARKELMSIFPELAGPSPVPAEPARPIVAGRRARKFAERIARNAKILAE